MGWFNKKDNKNNIEQMPQLPQLPDSPHTDILLHETINSPPVESPPSPIKMPDENKISLEEYKPPQKLTKNFSQEDFKSQNREPKPGMQKSKFSADYPVSHVSEYHTPFSEDNYRLPKIKDDSYPPVVQAPHPPMPRIKTLPKKDEKIFIRLDKFQATIEAFRDISQKIREIEELMAKTKEIKTREERELEEWEREIEAIKLKIDSIGKEISIPED